MRDKHSDLSTLVAEIAAKGHMLPAVIGSCRAVLTARGDLKIMWTAANGRECGAEFRAVGIYGVGDA